MASERKEYTYEELNQEQKNLVDTEIATYLFDYGLPQTVAAYEKTMPIKRRIFAENIKYYEIDRENIRSLAQKMGIDPDNPLDFLRKRAEEAERLARLGLTRKKDGPSVT